MSVGPRRTLVCRTDAIGDALLTLPVCAALKRADPKGEVVFLASDYAAEAVFGQPGVDRVIRVEPRASLARRLRSERFDAALMVFPDRSVSWAVWRAGIPVRVGTARRWWSWLYTHRVQHSRQAGGRHEAEYNLDLVKALGVPAKLEPVSLRTTAAARTWARGYLRQVGLRRGAFVILHPGGSGSSANWPPEAYAQLAARLQARRIQVFLTGSAAEQVKLAQIAQRCTPELPRLQETIRLPQLMALIAESAVFVSGNTGPMHLAAGLGVPGVAVFPAAGVTGPERWHPLGRSVRVLAPPRSAGPVRTLAAISVEAVLQAVLQVKAPKVRRARA